jgi:endonuclease YncB( thermonuclease family)
VRRLLSLLLLLPSLVIATPTVSVLEGKVAHIADGDTVTVLDDQHIEHKIRLAGMNAPESPSYQSVKNSTAFPTLDECLKSGGRLPKQHSQ